jgi:hypothetical protein
LEQLQGPFVSFIGVSEIIFCPGNGGIEAGGNPSETG